MLSPPRTVVRADGGLYALERALRRRGFTHVAGADEAGRGACAGPLVAAAVLLPPGRRGEIDELADSKLLTPAARERVYAQVTARAEAYSVVVVPPAEVDTRGLHVCNLAAIRRALAGERLTEDDAALIREYVVEMRASNGIGTARANKSSASIPK